MERECPNRRQLLLAGVAVVCCTTAEVPATSVSYAGNSLVIDLKKVPELRRPGSAVRVVNLDRKVNLIVVRGKKGHFTALDRSCTHGGAQVAYNRVNDTVQCSSWGHSEFALDGALLGGSAKRPLPAHACRLVGGKLEVTL
jgi:Rieske Fe-S protein